MEVEFESNEMLMQSCKKIINKGTGAGGSNTNLFGKQFEYKTSNQERLIQLGYIKNVFSKEKYSYLTKNEPQYKIHFFIQNELKKYMKHKHSIELFRCPDEAYLFEYPNDSFIIKIIEKKEQNVEGSVETKLWSGPSLKREYELVLGEKFKVEYAYCLNDFLKKKMISKDKKYMILQTILMENNIALLYGDDTNYFEMLDKWIYTN